jgi:hypothetical protein
MNEEMEMLVVMKLTEGERLAHLEEMRHLTGHDGTAPRSRQPKVNVRELVAAL